ncbi:SAM-dependent methyltransferase [Paenibacillus chitinolyticus]|uniref:methyltransferase n=1 Tax=Paenibacillus chitinolyticus TaxID=79263 RepID=UPI0026E4D6EE|nr:methyltransferase [Paenibacillus chitinolyticus]GKS11047.1 SAM-dependent methyltransferase [Paenibacillus chitinolyticus]
MDLTFSRITQLAFGYWQSQPLFLLAKFGICDLLAKEPLSAGQISTELHLHPQACEGLLNASVALKLLKKSAANESHYENTEMSSRYLTTKSHESLVHWVKVMGRWMEPWSKMDAVIESGVNAESQALRLGEDPEYSKDFILGMHEFARRYSDQFAESLDLSGCRYLLDIGGGAGTYSIALCKKYSDLKATILDLEPILKTTNEVVAASGFSERIHTKAANYHHDHFGNHADAILLSNVLHQESPEMCISILKRALQAMNDNGQLIVQSQFLEEDRITPTFTTLHNLSAWALWDGGRSYTVSEMSLLIEEAGFRNITHRKMQNNVESLILASK